MGRVRHRLKHQQWFQKLKELHRAVHHCRCTTTTMKKSLMKTQHELHGILSQLRTPHKRLPVTPEKELPIVAHEEIPPTTIATSMLSLSVSVNREPLLDSPGSPQDIFLTEGMEQESNSSDDGYSGPTEHSMQSEQGSQAVISRNLAAQLPTLQDCNPQLLPAAEIKQEPDMTSPKVTPENQGNRYLSLHLAPRAKAVKKKTKLPSLSTARRVLDFDECTSSPFNWKSPKPGWTHKYPPMGFNVFQLKEPKTATSTDLDMHVHVSHENQSGRSNEDCNPSNKESISEHDRQHTSGTDDHNYHGLDFSDAPIQKRRLPFCQSEQQLTTQDAIRYLGYSTREQEVTLRCSMCSASYTDVHQYVQHTVNIHGSYICHQCKKCFSSKKGLLCHRRTHTDMRRYSCCFCYRTYKHKWSCKVHIKRTHRLNYNLEEYINISLLPESLAD